MAHRLIIKIDHIVNRDFNRMLPVWMRLRIAEWNAQYGHKAPKTYSS